MQDSCQQHERRGAVRTAAFAFTSIACATALSFVVACGGDTPVRPSAPIDSTSTAGDPNSGGVMTVYDASSKAFGQPGPALTAEQLDEHKAGDAVFDATFVPTGPGNPVNPGLGPRFDNVSCVGCHTNDGRGRPPQPGDQFNSMIFRVSIAGSSAEGGPLAAPGYGTQLELRATPDLTGPMAVMSITYTDSAGAFPDGETYTLHVPHYTISAPYRTLPSNMLLSPRVAPPNFGLGLLEAVPADSIVALSTNASNIAAGVAGHPNYVWDAVGQKSAIGRFGFKANIASILEQCAAAANGDIGITTSVFPDEPCTDAVAGCGSHPVELSDTLLHQLQRYVQTLGVPARRSVSNTTVMRGEHLFQTVGCASCHQPTLHTGTVPGDPELSQQTIHPYTDLLLHDMGPGLADNRPDYLATGQEWRTTPLWGIGLTAVVNGHSTFLHDGRAQSLIEAIMWHGGQASAARDRFKALVKADRDAVVSFLNSL